MAPLLELREPQPQCGNLPLSACLHRSSVPSPLHVLHRRYPARRAACSHRRHQRAARRGRPGPSPPQFASGLHASTSATVETRVREPGSIGRWSRPRRISRRKGVSIGRMEERKIVGILAVDIFISTCVHQVSGDEPSSERKVKCYYHQSGVSAVLCPLDSSVETHMKETIVEGVHLCNEDTVEIVCTECPERVKE